MRRVRARVCDDARMLRVVVLLVFAGIVQRVAFRSRASSPRSARGWVQTCERSVSTRDDDLLDLAALPETTSIGTVRSSTVFNGSLP